ncbi:hypothetical protein GCM10007887_04440 [Methylobacterium haplocladii]|uniref:HNH nuclease domain-containing protein n=1 Tax=Methylobacterium haplocladii TaxID=1176176 RepID=A0A512ISG5_9HYPH|nr:hypothetical protein MHA02_30270 [Methylobacterium haplocladii]GLS57788.1 hypothetical protein GCM10007887_04440 [Methylobacterium haplocladii]
MTYEEYLASPRWAELRRLRLALDGFRCRGCDTADNLEVHHRRYGTPLGSETVDDLTTLCGGPEGCHHAITTIIRRRLYATRQYDVTAVARLAPGNLEKNDVPGLRAFKISAHRRVAPGHAQRSLGEPAGLVCEGAEGGLGKARQDGR